MATTLTTTRGSAPTTIDYELCDRCGVRARVHVVLRSGADLYFCSHHARGLSDALERAGAWLNPIAL